MVGDAGMIAGAVLLLIAFLACAVLCLRGACLRMFGALLGGVVLVGVALPLSALWGVPPFWVALPGAVGLAFAGSFLVGGRGRKSLVAALGASSALVLAGVLPVALSSVLQLSGLDVHFGPRPHVEVTLWFGRAFGRVDFGQLAVCAIALAALGAVMDVAMVIASSAREAVASGAGRCFGERFGLGVRVGARALGPMAATMLLIVFGADLPLMVARAGRSWSLWEALTLFNYESLASETMETACAAVGMLCGVPLTALFAAWILRPPDGAARAPVRKRSGIAPAVALRALGVAAVVLAALAVESGFMAWYDRAPVTEDAVQGSRSQDALARVIRVEPGVSAPLEEGAAFNPVRGKTPDRQYPCAAELLTGERCGSVVFFVNMIEGRPYVNVRLRKGSLVLFNVTRRGERVVLVVMKKLPMRWRPLLWIAAGTLGAMIALLGLSGARAAAMTLCVGAAVMIVTVPLLARGCWPPAALLLTFGIVSAVMLVGWGEGMRAGLCAGLGALAGLAVGGMGAFAAVRALGVTGEASFFFRLLRQAEWLASLDFGLLIAAGATLIVMGAAVDVAASVVSGLIEHRRADPAATPAETRRVGLRLSRDVSGTMVLTLWFAWLAMRLPVLLLMYGGRGVFGPKWMACYVTELTQIVCASVAVMLSGPLAVAAFSVMFSKAPLPKPREGSRRGQVVVCLALLCVALVAAVCLWRSWRPDARAVAAGPGHAADAESIRSWAEEGLREGNWGESVRALWRARRLAPGDAKVRRDLAYAYLLRGRLALARDSIDRAAASLKDDARTRYILGVLAMWDGDWQSARHELKRALELDPNLDAARRALGRIPQSGAKLPQKAALPGQSQ